MKNVKKLFSLLIIVSVILSGCLTVYAAPVNLASGATVIKSGAGGQAKVNDGVISSNNSGSAYINSVNGSNYIGFDLGEEKKIGSIIIYESSNATKHIGSFVIETADNSSFTNAVTVASGTEISSGGTTLALSSPVTAQYIRFRPTSYAGSDTSGMVYIAEIKVMSAEEILSEPTNTADDNANLASNASFTSGGGASSSNLSRLKDGTKYITSNSYAYNFGSASDRFLICDLGEIKYINTVKIYEYSKTLNLEGYELLYSYDGTTWLTLASVNGAGTNGGLVTHQFEKTAARYIKMVLKSASGNVYLAELEVYYMDTVITDAETDNLINSENISSATSPYIYDGDKLTSLGNTLPADTITAEIIFKNAEAVKALKIYFTNGENIGSTKVYAGDSESSHTLIYNDSIGLSEKVIPVDLTSVKYIKIILSGISGESGIADIEGFANADIINDYIPKINEAVSSYIINQARSLDTVALPEINSSVWTVSDPSAAYISGLTLNITNEEAAFTLKGTLDLGSSFTSSPDIVISRKDTISVTPAVPETGDIILIAGADINVFTDIDNSWAYNYIVDLNKLKIISGVTRTSFEPEREITRAEFVKLLAESLMLYDKSSVSDYKDISKNDWYCSYIASLEKAGALGSIWEDNFYPEEYITREDMAYFTYNSIKAKNISLNHSSSYSFTDYDSISEYARDAVNYLSQTGFIEGNPDGTFNPKGNLTRAEASKIIYLIYTSY